MKYKEIKGDLISLALAGEFDVIAHGCNCFSKQKSGIAKEMVEHFNTDMFKDEQIYIKGYEILKLGNIDWELKWISPNGNHCDRFGLSVVNCYTQYQYGIDKVNLDYEAFTLCMRKMNRIFMGEYIGLPQIGCGLAGGDWNRVKEIIQRELKDCQVTVVIYDK
jgi:O-acetyl-ADP-ribose deacetylase (regulator of RNase III)